MASALRNLTRAIGSLKITVAGLLLLLVLTIWGTLYQAHHGLYGAQERFYQSWAFTVGGFIPFPGAQSVMVLLFANLAASLLHMALTRRLRLGFVATHAGLALMLAAGGITFYLGRSAHLSLVEGEASNVALSSQDWELAMVPAADGSHRHVSAMDARDLRPGRRIPLPGTDLILCVESYLRNSTASDAAIEGAPMNAAGHTALSRKAPSGEPGADLPGLLASVERQGKTIAHLLLWGGDPAPTPLPGSEQPMLIGLRHLRLPLPATIKLIDFKRELHPGTGMARSYSSQVSIQAGADTERSVLISMNKPLRLAGYTFYQSSFSSAPGGRDVSTLAVVQNHGRVLPYVATGMTGLGMILHFSGLLFARMRGTRREAGP